jgi:hypothetical protein
MTFPKKSAARRFFFEAGATPNFRYIASPWGDANCHVFRRVDALCFFAVAYKNCQRHESQGLCKNSDGIHTAFLIPGIETVVGNPATFPPWY